LDWTEADAEAFYRQWAMDRLLWTWRGVSVLAVLVGIICLLYALGRARRTGGLVVGITLVSCGLLMVFPAFIMPTSSEKILRLTDFDQLAGIYLSSGPSILGELGEPVRPQTAIEFGTRMLASERMRKIGTGQDFGRLVRLWLSPPGPPYGRENLGELIYSLAPESVPAVLTLMPSMRGDDLLEAHNMLECMVHREVPYPDPHPQTQQEVDQLVELWRRELRLPDAPR